MMIVNCTGATLLIGEGSGDSHEYVECPAARVPARVVTEEVHLPGLDVKIVRDTGVEGLPDPEDGVWYLVTSRVAMAASERDDLLIPGGIREWGNGQRVVRELLRPEPTMRGLGHGLPDLVDVGFTLGDYNSPWSAQVSAEKSQDGTWTVHCNAPIGEDGSHGTRRGLTQGQALAALGDLLPAAQQWGRTYEEQQTELL